jgi:thiamine biosynthesis lipoprotein
VEPALGIALELAGYDRDWDSLEHLTDENEQMRCSPAQERARPRIRATVRAGWRAIELDPERATIRVPLGVRLDLGATAKAWAADRASRAVRESVGCGVLVSLGGDIATAGRCPAGGWRVHVTDDHRDGPDAPGQTISIAGGGLATSSTVARRWLHKGRAMHHIIDPRTGVPATGVWRTASVAAMDCTDANIAATATLVRGADAPAWLTERGLPARLVSQDGEVLTVGDWPEPRA